MAKQWDIRSDFSIVPLPDRSVLLIGERLRVHLPEITVDQLEALLHSGEQTELLARLRQASLLAPAGGTLPREQAGFWEACGIPAADAAARLAAGSVTIAGSREFVGVLSEALERSRVRVSPAGAIRIVECVDYLDEVLGRINSAGLESRQPWLLARPGGRESWVGPLFQPGRNACWCCLRHSLLENRHADLPLWGAGVRMPAEGRVSLPANLTIVAGVVALELVKWIVMGESRLCRGLLTIDSATAETHFHPIVRRPDCPYCQGLGRPAVWGAPRVPAPDLEAPVRHLSRITGFLSGLERRSCESWSPIEIWSADYVRPLNLRNPFLGPPPGICVGRGISEQEARAACLFEGVERYSSFSRGTEEVVRANEMQLQSRVLPLRDLLQFSERQISERARTNTAVDTELAIPEPLDASTQIDWVELECRTGGPAAYAPASYVYLGYAEPSGCFCAADSNGCAAGADDDSALLSGMSELVERDAAALWWYNRATRPQVSIDNLEHPFLRSVEATFAANSRRIWLLDLTTEWGIPVFAAISCDHSGNRIAWGLGASLSPESAAISAITETVQAIYSLEGRAAESPECRYWWKEAAIGDHEYLLPHGLSDGADQPARGIQDLFHKARELELEVFTANLSRPEIGIPVVRVVIPGLRPAGPRFSPGRLFEAPVRLGWINEPKREEEMNPRPLLL
jgi:ribosomal protein S12 methylthiotransferase accessory factor